jgi:hypothetical protein
MKICRTKICKTSLIFFVFAFHFWTTSFYNVFFAASTWKNFAAPWKNFAAPGKTLGHLGKTLRHLLKISTINRFTIFCDIS